MGNTAVAIELSESERRELEVWRRGERRRRGWPNAHDHSAGGGGAGEQRQPLLQWWRLRPTPWASGDGGSRSVASMVSTTNPVRARRARSATTRSLRSFARR